MPRNTSPNTGAAASCGYLIVLVLISWALIIHLPYILAGVAACLLVWLLVRYHREAWVILQLVGRLLGWIARHCQQPSASEVWGRDRHRIGQLQEQPMDSDRDPDPEKYRKRKLFFGLRSLITCPSSQVPFQAHYKMMLIFCKIVLFAQTFFVYIFNLKDLRVCLSKK